MSLFQYVIFQMPMLKRQKPCADDDDDEHQSIPTIQASYTASPPKGRTRISLDPSGLKELYNDLTHDDLMDDDTEEPKEDYHSDVTHTTTNEQDRGHRQPYTQKQISKSQNSDGSRDLRMDSNHDDLKDTSANNVADKTAVKRQSRVRKQRRLQTQTTNSRNPHISQDMRTDYNEHDFEEVHHAYSVADDKTIWEEEISGHIPTQTSLAQNPNSPMEASTEINNKSLKEEFIDVHAHYSADETSEEYSGYSSTSSSNPSKEYDRYSSTSSSIPPDLVLSTRSFLSGLEEDELR